MLFWFFEKMDVRIPPARKTLALALVGAVCIATNGFQPVPSFQRHKSRTSMFSSTGDGGDRPRNRGEWDQFLNPDGEESENLRRAREYFAEESLPISFEAVKDSTALNNTKQDNGITSEEATSSAITMVEQESTLKGQPTAEMIQNNPYIKVVSSLSPSDLISKFTKTAHPRVQNAVRSTILGLIGNLPKMAFDTTTITTGQRLASLMFQLQMTGYMFKNADYRLSLSQSLGMTNPALGSSSANFLLEGSEDEEDDHDDDDTRDPLVGKVKGKLKVRYGSIKEDGKQSAEKSDSDDDASAESPDEDGVEIEVDAAAYMSELRSEVSMLRDELTRKREMKEEALRKDLLLYIRTLPEQGLRSLTSTVSPDVLVAMKGLVNAVMAGIGEGEIGPDTVTEQSGEAMAQLCMWQLVVGYNLRELEVREEMKNALMSKYGEVGEDDWGVDLSSPGALE
jgi:hypothetical protein